MIKTSVSFSKEGNNEVMHVSLPKDWQELSQGQLRYVCTLIASGKKMIELKYYAIMRFLNVQVIEEREKAWMVRYRNGMFGSKYMIISEDEISWAADELSFLDSFPQMPVRLEKENGAYAVDAFLHGVRFGQYLQMENAWQSVLKGNTNAVESICNVLYRRRNGKKVKVSPVMYASTMVWFSSFKEFCKNHWPNLFRKVEGEGEDINMEQVMNSQIRGLTQGDATKEREVLNLDVWRALTELDAKAEEAEEQRKQLNSIKSK